MVHYQERHAIFSLWVEGTISCTQIDTKKLGNMFLLLVRNGCLLLMLTLYLFISREEKDTSPLQQKKICLITNVQEEMFKVLEALEMLKML